MMNPYKIKANPLIFLSALLTALILTLSGCSSSYNTSARAMPQIPEIRSNVPRSRPKPAPRKAIAKLKPPVAKVKKYSITSTTSTVITQKDVAVVMNKEDLRIEAKKQATVEIDPYASIPENSSSSSNVLSPAAPSLPATKSVSSPAVVSLMVRARADLAIGRTQSAVSKLERGLRIESQNPKIWNLLAKAHYDQSNYQQAISMAKKSIRYASGDRLIAQNWELIKKAGEKSDDTIALKEALNYFKVNP